MFISNLVCKMFIISLICLTIIHMALSIEDTKKRRCKKVCRDDYEQLEKRVEQLEDTLKQFLQNKDISVTLKGPKGDRGERGLQGPPGPQGYMGLTGPKSKDGSSLSNLPVCLAGEYITSDGTNLFCAKLGNIARPNIIHKSKPTKRPLLTKTIKPDGRQPHPPIVIKKNKETQTSSSSSSEEQLKFVQKYSISSLYTDAWDLHSFTWKGNSYLGVSQVSENSFILYKWVQTFFVEKAVLTIPKARKWKSFEWKGDLYLVIACFTKGSNSTTGSSYIYKLVSYDHIELYQKLETNGAFGVDVIQKHGHLFIVFAYLYAEQSDVFKWHDGKFVKNHQLNVGGRDIEGFHIGHRSFVAVIGVPNNPQNAYLFEYRHGQFVPFRNIPVGADQPTAIKHFQVGKGHYLAIARYKQPKSLLLKWNGESFEESQKLDSCKATGFASMTVDGDGGKQITYLAVTNYDCAPVIYIYDKNIKSFTKLQQIDSKRTRDIEFLKSDNKGDVYIAVSTNKETSVYSREQIG